MTLFERRVRRLYRQAFASITLSVFASLYVYFLFLQSGRWELLTPLALPFGVQALRLVDVLHYRRLADPDRHAASALRRYSLGVAATAAAWLFYAAALLPQLSSSGERVAALCMFTALLFSNVSTLSVFPRLAIGFAIGFGAPIAIGLLLQVDKDWAWPLGLVTGCQMLLAIPISLLSYLNEIKRLAGKSPEASAPVAEDADWLERAKVDLLYRRSVLGTFSALGMSFVIAAQVSATSEDPALWYWLVAMDLVQLLRLAHVLYYFLCRGRGHSPKGWELRFAIGLVPALLVWYVLMLEFIPALQLYQGIFVLAILYSLAVASVLTLAVSRAIVISYVLAMLLPVAVYWLDLHGAALLSLDAVMVALMMIVLMSLIINTNRVTLQALHVQHTRELAERRERQAQQLNSELQLVRRGLVDANASLEQKVAERTASLERLASCDALTGLSNRLHFTSIVVEAIQRCEQQSKIFAICFIDLDRFKEINDGLGHSMGDRVLRTVARRLTELCGEGVSCARWGGDEFLLLIDGERCGQPFSEFAETVRQRLCEPMEEYGVALATSASMGMAIYPKHGSTAAELIESADIAVYRAKLLGRGRICHFQSSWGAEARERVELAQALRRAIESGALEVRYQPVVDIGRHCVHGFEALLRWPSAEHGEMSPASFIPLAEDMGLMPQLGRFVLFEACSTMQHMFPHSDGPLLAVNVSVSQIMGEGFLSTVRQALASSRLPPHRLELEVTESLFAGNLVQVQAALSQLRTLGVRISIDDFGTGYSSLSYLRTLPLDTLKIDRSFVKDLSFGGELIFTTLIRLAQGLKLQVIVEGVESEVELHKVVKLGGELVQGYFFSRPIRADEILNWTSGLALQRGAA